MQYNSNIKDKKYVFESEIKNLNKYEEKIVIKTVNNKRDFKEFYKVPWEIYKDDSNWIPPLWDEINDFFKNNNSFWDHTKTELFIAYKNKKLAGRIAAFIDEKYCELIDNTVGFFGFFECINDYEISSELFKIAENWIRSYKIKKMVGPIDGRVDVGFGILYKGFNQKPFFPDKYSPRYYINLIEKNQMKKSRDFYSYYIDLKKSIPDKLRNAALKCIDETKVNIRFFNKKNSKDEINWWSNFMIKTFANHWGYVPVKTEEIMNRYGIKNIRWFLDNRLFLIAEKDEKPIGFSWTFPNYNLIFKDFNGKLNFINYLKFYKNLKNINQANMNIIGIDKKFQKKNVASLLNFNTISELKKRGYESTVIGVADENNIASKKIIEKTNAKLMKIYRIYQKNINI